MSSRFAWALEDVEFEDLTTLGGAGSGNHGHAGRKGHKGGSAQGSSEARASRALATYKPSTRATQKVASRSVNTIASYLSGVATDDHQPMDVLVEGAKTLHGIEVKTLIDTTRDAITMHPESLRRKIDWVKEHKAEGHTVAVDKRSSSTAYYYRKGFGSFRLGSMQPVTLSELKALVK